MPAIARRLIEQLDRPRRGEIHDGAGRHLGAEAEGDGVAVLHLVHRVGIADEAHLDVLVGQAVDLQKLAGDLLAGIAALLGGDRLALEVGDRVDAGVGGDDELVILRIERGDVADIGRRLGERPLPCTPSTVEIELPKPMSALPSSTPRTLAMPAPGSTCTLRPGTAFSHMSLSWPPSGIHEPPCGPVIIFRSAAEAGAASASARPSQSPSQAS